MLLVMVAMPQWQCVVEYPLGIDPGVTPDAPACTPRAATELSCSDNVDDDCDGFADCLDPDCEARSCGAGGGLLCTSGACLRPGEDGLPPLPRIDNVRVRTRGDTAIVEFGAIDGARDYRIYPRPNAADVTVGAGGAVTIRNAIYRCAGDVPRNTRQELPYYPFDRSLAGDIGGYTRTEAEATLGYVYLTPGVDRQAVYRVSRPNGSWNMGVAPYSEFNSADYVLGTTARDALVARGMRDDGIAFYAPNAGARVVYRTRFASDPGNPNARMTVFYVDGPEALARAAIASPEDSGERFRVLAEPATGAVPLRRITHANYQGEEWFDHLAAGQEHFERLFNQGNRPVLSLTWPGLTARTTLVIEALDVGCPFPNGYIAANAAPRDPQMGDQPSITLDQARWSTGEVFVNGQHDNSNQPRAVARAYVDVAPQSLPRMDWSATFDPGASWEPLTLQTESNGHFLHRNTQWAIDFAGCTENLTLGPLLGQFAVGFGDWGSSCVMAMSPQNIRPQLFADRYLHVRMSTDIPATFRRYPQMILTTMPVIEPLSMGVNRTALHTRLADTDVAAQHATVVVQPFGINHELQVQFCDRQTWGVSAQCPRAAIYGVELGNDNDRSPWRPVPMLGDVVGFDRPVQFDVYASTQRVYVLIDGRPAACAALPAGRMPEGPLTVAFGAVLFHSGIDEGVTGDNGLAPHLYLRRFSLTHTDRRFDDLGISVGVSAPRWDEARLPCATRWIGASF